LHVESICKQPVDESTATEKEFSCLERKSICKALSSYFQSTGEESECILLAYKIGGFTLKEIAGYYGIHYSTMSYIVSKLEEV